MRAVGSILAAAAWNRANVVGVRVRDGDRVELPLQVVENNSAFRTPFAPTITLRTRSGDHSAVSARLETLRRVIAEDARPEEFVSPGSVYPLIANPAGVIARNGQTEGSYDMARLAGLV